MIVSEEIAKTKRCHRYPFGSYRCLASDCMAWRIAGERYFDKFGHPLEAGSAHIDHSRTLTEGGFCGLAGRP